uniref:Uncharacterized protein n=1 Tax=uncultured crenarchaeote TaxID=29281 RepID=Q702E0_9CREN|nr:hypothetical protein [uncultured crenarchaeote]
MSGLPFNYELLILVCSITVFGLIVYPTSHVIATSEKTAASSSIKETIDQVVSDTLNGMMEDTINNLLKNTSKNLIADDNTSNAGFQNKLPSSVDIAQITSNTTQVQETERTELNNSINNEGTNQNTKSHATNEVLVNQQNESAKLNRAEISQAIIQNPHNLPVDSINSNSEIAKNQTGSNHVKPTNFIDDLIYKVRQLFFK